MLAAQNIRAKRGCNAAPPLITPFSSPPNASRHLLKISLFARASFAL